MQKDRVAAMKQGEKMVGTFFELGGTTAAESLALSGLDFIIIDTEHGIHDVESALPAVIACERHGVVPFVRVKDPSRASVLKMLDIGARGLIVPCIQTIEEVRGLVEYGKYHPVGCRGFAPTRAAQFGHHEFGNDLEAYFRAANERTLLIPQCETAGCLAVVEEVAATEGIDGIFVGPYDLSIALGIPGQFEHPTLLAAIDRVKRACKEHGKLALIYAGSSEATKAYLADGFDAVACAMDCVFLTDALTKFVTEVKGA